MAGQEQFRGYTAWELRSVINSSVTGEQARALLHHAVSELGILRDEVAALRKRVADLTEAARDAHKHLPYGGTRDWVGEVLGIRTVDDEDE